VNITLAQHEKTRRKSVRQCHTYIMGRTIKTSERIYVGMKLTDFGATNINVTLPNIPLVESALLSN